MNGSRTASRTAGARRLLASARVRAGLSLGVVLAVGATGTFAYWTDNVTVSGTTFTAGTIDLRVNNLDTIPSYTALNLPGMVPGDSVAGVLTIKNAGTSPLKYTAVTAATTPDAKNLKGTLVVKVTGDATATGTAPSATCAGTALAGSAATLGGALIPTGRLLAPGGTETLCVQVTLPTTAPNSVQGGTTDVTFTFTGTSDLS